MSSESSSWAVNPIVMSSHMSEHETLMWQLEKDPWFDPSGASVAICDRPLNMNDFKRRLRWMIVNTPRLREIVVSPIGKLTTPEWHFDEEFDLSYHVRRIALPGGGSQRELLDLCAVLYQDPFDRSRPLWRITVIEGLESGNAAILIKMHHTIADGIGSLKMAEFYMQLSADEELPPDIDLAEHRPEPIERTESDSSGIPIVGLLRKVAGEVASWGADPLRVVDIGTDVVAAAQGSIADVFGDGDDHGSSPLFMQRSRQRRFDVVSVDLDKAKKAASRLGGTINDLFLTGVAQGAISYHDDVDVQFDTLSMTFVISTREKGDRSSNAFIPVRLPVDASDMPITDRFNAISAAAGAQKSGRSGNSSMAVVGTIATKLPTSIVTKVARKQSAGIDIATSNLRGAPFEVFISGARVVETYPFGPVAGTAANVTAMSYDGTIYIGISADPVAITDPDHFQRAVQASFDSLLRTRKPKSAAKK